MARDWFGRKTDTSGISELDGYYDQPGGWRLWVRRIVGVFVILALLAAFIWAARWVYSSVTDDSVDNGGESGQVTSPGDDSIDTGTPTDDGATNTDTDTGTSGSTDTSSNTTSGTNDTSTSNGTGSTGTNGSTEDSSMPQTGDDSGDTPAGTDVLPATGG